MTMDVMMTTDYLPFSAPSPRQRCRIKTNPWLSTIEPEPLIMPAVNSPSNKKRDRNSTGSTTSSSGIKSNSDESNEQKNNNSNGTSTKKPNGHITDSDSSSSTEKPSKTLVSLTEFRRKYGKPTSQLPISISTTTQHEGSDEDATLNEIGKFDESYVYEKENDIIR
jgi:hypothetical protein